MRTYVLFRSKLLSKKRPFKYTFKILIIISSTLKATFLLHAKENIELFKRLTLLNYLKNRA